MSYRVLRGGSFKYDSRGLRTSVRNWLGPEDRYWYSGFRIVVRRKKP